MYRPNKGQIVDEKVVIIFIIITMLLATFLSCMCFSYELLDFLGMATRESRHAYFCFLQTPQFSKDLRVYLESPKESSYPYSRHGFTDYTNNF